MAGRFSVEAVFKAVDRITAPVSRMQNRVRKFTRSMGIGLNKLNRSVNKFTAGIRRMGSSAAVAGVLFGALATNVIAAGASFEQAITDVGAVSLQTRAQIEPLEKLALKLGRTTKFTSTQAANAMEVMARAGFKVNEIIDATPAVLKAAAASGLEIAEVANHVSNVLKGMGLATTQTARVADVLALASARTNSSIGSLGESMKNVASTARQLNIPLEDVVAGVALLQDVGLDASVAGSAFNVMLTQMAAPSTRINKVMRRLGVSFKDAKGDMKPLPTVIAEISKASKKMGGNFDQVAFLAELVGLRGQKAAANLANLFETGKLKDLTEELKNATGSAAKMASLKMDTFLGDIALLGSAVDAVKVKVFGLSQGVLRDVTQQMTKWVSANEDLIATKVGDFIGLLITNFDSIFSSLKKIGTTIAVLFSLIAILKTLTLVLTVINLVMAANPVVLITLAIFALIAAVAALIIWWDEAVQSFRESAIGMDLMLIGIGALFGPLGLLVAAAALIFKHWAPIKTFFAELWGGVVSIFDSAIDKIMAIVDRVKAATADIGGAISGMGGGVADFFGFGEGENQGGGGSRGDFQIVSPQDRVARSVDEHRTTSSAEVTIRDESGRAEVTGGQLGQGLSLQSSGGM